MSKKHENFFSQLRSVAVKAERQSSELKELLAKPPSQRSTSSVSSELMLRDMLKDVKNLTSEAKAQAKDMQTRQNSFNDVVKASQTLYEFHLSQYQELKAFLCKYGYQPPKKKAEKNVNPQTEKSHVTETEEMKENLDLAQEESAELVEESLVCTSPPKDQNKLITNQNSTPKLEDFGLSRNTLEMLARQKHYGGPATAAADTRTVDDVTYCVTSGLQTRTESDRPSRSEYYDAPPEEFRNEGILTTPGLWSGRAVPGYITPKQGPFGRMAADALDSPVPPVFATPGVKQIKKAAANQKPQMSKLAQDSHVDTVSPATPILQSHPRGHSQVTLSPAPLKPQSHSDAQGQIGAITGMRTPSPMQFISQSVNPEDMPEPEPPEITTWIQFQPLPTQPVLHANNMYATEMREAPSLNLKYPQASSAQSDTSAHESQKQDMLTASYQPTKPANTSHPQQSITTDHYQSHQARSTPAFVHPANQPANHQLANSLVKCIQPVMPEEMSQLNDYLQLLLPLDQLNEIINKINSLIAQNGSGGQFIRKSELPLLDLGPHTNSVMLLLVKMGRLQMEKKDPAGQLVHYIL